MTSNEWAFMEDLEWETRRAKLIAEIQQMPPTRLRLRSGEDLLIETATSAQAQIVYSITREAFIEHRGVLDPPNGSDFESHEDVANQMLKGGALIGYIDGSSAASLRMTVYPDYLYIGRVGVVPQFRRNGIGRAMISHAEKVAACLRLPEVRLGTREKLSDNVALYLKLGYTIERVGPHPRGTDRVVLFSKRVTSDPPGNC